MLRWLRDNDFINNSEMRTTHTLMTGGVVGVPDSRYDEFLSLYATEVRGNNKTLSFCELRSDPVFCMYFDIDMLNTNVPSAGVSANLTSLIQTVVKSYYAVGAQDDGRFLCVVCDTPAKSVVVEEGRASKKTLAKNGYHITFPNLRVNLSQALQIRYSVVYELERTMGKRDTEGGLNSWPDVVDKAVYSSGLRMCGSFKRVKCSDCKKTDPAFKDKKKALLSSMAKLRRKIHPREHGFDYADLGDIHADEFKDAVFGEMYGKYLELTGFNSCRTCLNTGKRMENRTYMPSLAVDGSGDPDASLLDQMREDYSRAMRYTSIRCQEGEVETPGFCVPKGVPKAPTEENGANMRSFSSKKLTHLGGEMRAFVSNNDIYLSDAETMHLWRGPRVLDDLRLSVIEKFVRESVCEAYASVQVRKVCESQVVKKVAPKASGGSKLINSLVGAHSGTVPPAPPVTVSNRYLVNVAGVGSTFCMNKGAEHTSNSVYFIITASHCYQRCFSRKTEIREGGTTCGEYRSGGVPVPLSVSAVLFPDDVSPGREAGVAVSKPATASKKGSKRRRLGLGATDWATKKL